MHIAQSTVSGRQAYSTSGRVCSFRSNGRSHVCRSTDRSIKEQAGTSSTDCKLSQESNGCPVLSALQDPPEVRPPGLLGNLQAVFGDSFTYQSEQLQGRPLVKTRVWDTMYYTGDPSLSREVMTDDSRFRVENLFRPILGDEGVLYLAGEEHQRVRALLVPAFVPEEIEEYTPQVQDLVAQSFAQLADKCARRGRPVAAHERNRRLTFEVISRVVVGLQLSERDMQELHDDFTALPGGVLAKIFALPGMDLPFMPGGKCKAARSRIAGRLEALIGEAEARVLWQRESNGGQRESSGEQRESNGGQGESNGGQGEGVEAKTVDQSESGEQVPSQGVLQRMVEQSALGAQSLTRKQMVDNLLLFLFAGYDSTSSLITSIMYYAATQPQHWQIVVEEQRRLVAQHGSRLTPTLLRSAMPAAEHFVRETLRLRLPFVFINRVVPEETQLGGYRIPKGADMGVMMTLLNRSDPLWERETGDLAPAAFNPSRFARLAPGQSPQMMPFGVGKHSCIGQPLALMEARVAAAVLARDFSIQLGEEPKTWSIVPATNPLNGLPVMLTRQNV